MVIFYDKTFQQLNQYEGLVGSFRVIWLLIKISKKITKLLAFAFLFYLYAQTRSYLKQSLVFTV